jgi:hypothetical protein
MQKMWVMVGQGWPGHGLAVSGLCANQLLAWHEHLARVELMEGRTAA